MFGSSEDIVIAARIIRDAADKMAASVNQLSEAMERQQRFMDDWLDRFTQSQIQLLPGETGHAEISDELRDRCNANAMKILEVARSMGNA